MSPGSGTKFIAPGDELKLSCYVSAKTMANVLVGPVRDYQQSVKQEPGLSFVYERQIGENLLYLLFMKICHTEGMMCFFSRVVETLPADFHNACNEYWLECVHYSDGCRVLISPRRAVTLVYILTICYYTVLCRGSFACKLGWASRNRGVSP